MENITLKKKVLNWETIEKKKSKKDNVLCDTMEKMQII